MGFWDKVRAAREAGTPDPNNLTPGEARALMTAVITMGESVQTLQQLVVSQTEELLAHRDIILRQSEHIDTLTKVLVSQDGVWARMAEQTNQCASLVAVVARAAAQQVDEVERNRPNIVLHQMADIIS
jgi:hypothetical protein